MPSPEAFAYSLYCNTACGFDGRVQSKSETINFCDMWRKRGKNNVNWHANEALGHKTETIDFLSEKRPRARPPVNFPRRRRTKIGLKTESKSLQHAKRFVR